MLTSKFVPYWFVTPCLLFNNLYAEYDYGNSDDNSVVDSDDYSCYIKMLKFFSLFNEYNQCKEYENDQPKEYNKTDKEYVKKLFPKILVC